MSMIWAICGAGRGVGKTRLARELVRVLPNAVYAKCGRGRVKPGRPRNFFTSLRDLEAFIKRQDGRQHVVVESGGLARRGAADMSIYVEGMPGKTSVRKDAAKLRSACDICVGPAESAARWRRVLGRKVPQAKLRRLVCDLLAEQKRHICGAAAAVRSKIWFVVGDLHTFGSGLATLLSGIQRCGTLRAAAAAAGMSYRRAWDLIRSAEKNLGARLILPKAGGAGGGGSSLAPEGRHLLTVYRRLNDEVVRFANRRFAALYAKEKADG